MSKSIALVIIILMSLAPVTAIYSLQPLAKSLEDYINKKTFDGNQNLSLLEGNKILDRAITNLDKIIKMSMRLRFGILEEIHSTRPRPIISGTTIIPIGGIPLPVNITVIKLPYDADNIRVFLEPISKRYLRADAYDLGMDPVMVAPTIGDYRQIKPSYEVDLPLYTVNIYRGIDPTTLERATYLVIHVYPMRPLSGNRVVIYEDVRIDLRYQTRGLLMSARGDKIDVLIITSRSFAPAAEKLASLKHGEGLRSMIKFVEDIYSEFEGQDSQEKIRNCIRAFVQNSDVTFVIILGDSEIIPVRDVYIPDGAYDDDPEIDGKLVETDLYYADLQYSWDDNGDGLWGDLRYDRVDGIPDVIVGRLPVSNLTEALNVIEKMVRYYPAIPMYSRVIFAGTDTFQIGYPEGEYLLEFSKGFVKDMAIVKLYETLGNLTRASFKTEFDRGAYLIAFTGHGLPDSLALTFSQTYTIGDAYAQVNRIYPIFVALSCDAGWFRDIDGLGEALILNPSGGAIAFFGSTKIAWGYIGELITTGLMGEVFWRTIKNMFDENLRRNLGRVWAQTIIEYVTRHSIVSTLSGYYLDWKTVSGYVLLGDPTLSITPRAMGKITDKGNITVIDDSLLIFNETVIIRDLICDNATIVIENSTVILQGRAEIARSTLIVNRSVIISNSNIRLENTDASFVGSLALVKLVTLNASLNISRTVLGGVEVHLGLNDVLVASNSTFNLLIRTTNGAISLSDLREGFLEYLDLSQIGLNCLISNSVVMFGITATGGYVYLNNVMITSFYMAQGSAILSNSVIAGVQLDSSEVSIMASNVTISLVLSNLRDLTISGLKPGRQSAVLHIGDSSITLQDAYIGGWSILLNNVSARIEDSKLCMLASNDSTVDLSGTRLAFLSTSRSDAKLERVPDLLMAQFEYSKLYASNVTAKNIELNHSIGDVSDSRVTSIDLNNSNLTISSSRIECMQSITSSVAINNSTLVTARICGSSNVTLYNSRSAVIDVEDSVRLIVNRSRIIYWLRIYDSANIIASNSIIWFGLVFERESFEIQGLEPGNTSSLVLDKAKGWSIRLSNVLVIGWDVLSYNSNITLNNSKIGWVFLFYVSRLLVLSSEVSLIRITHDSVMNITESVIDGIYASGSSKSNIYRSIVSTIYVLGNAEVNLNKVVFEIVAGFGSAARAKILASYGGIVAAISGISINIERSVVTIYLGITEENAYFRGFKPGYLSSWSSDILNVDESWYVSVKNSHASWILDLSLGSFVVEDSLLSHLYLSNATTIIRNVLVSDVVGIYGSKLFVNNSRFSAITIIWGSDVVLYETASIYTYIIESSVIMNRTVANVILGFLEGNYELRLKPGYYKNSTLDEFVNASTPIRLKLIDTSIAGWYVIGLGIYGRVGLRIVESDVISVGIAYNGSLILENSRVYGYSEVYLEEDSDTSATIINSATRLYLTLYRIEETVNIEEIGAYHPISINILNNLRIINTTILEVSIDTYGTNLNIRNSRVRTLSSSGSEVLIKYSKVDEISARDSTIYLVSSKVGSAKLVLCDAVILNSKVEDFIPYLTEFLVRESEIGLSIYFAFAKFYVRDLRPISISSASVPEDIPMFARGLLINTKIIGWRFIIGEFSQLEVYNSRIHKVDVSSHTSTVVIESSTVDSISIKRGGNITINRSAIGIDVNIINLDLTLKNLGEGFLQNATTNNLVEGPSPWNINAIQSEITMLNVTIHGSSVNLKNINALIILINASSYASISDSSALYLIDRGSSNLKVSSSFVRLVNPGYGTELYVSNSRVGIVNTFVYGTVELRDIQGVPSLRGEQLGYKIYAHVQDLIDLTILAAMFSNVTVINSYVFTVGSDGFARIWLIDTMLEYPIFAEDLSEIHILYTLTVEVLYDLREPEMAKVIITGKDTRVYELDAPRGRCSIVLYQGIVRSYERIDLGSYTIKASVEGFSASRSIYLWKPTKVSIIIIGALLRILIMAVVALIVTGLIIILKKRAEERSPAGLAR